MLNNKKIDQAIILCGGFGTRIKNVTKNKIPKSLIPVNDIPFIYYLIIQILTLDIRKIIFCTGYLSNLIEEDVSNFVKHNNLNIQIFFIKEPKPLGTAGAIRNVSNYLNGLNTIVFNGDTYVKGNLQELINFHFLSNSFISLTASFKFLSSRYGKISFKKNLLNKINEKKISFFSYVYSGIFIINNNLINKCPIDTCINVENFFFDSKKFKILIWKNNKSFLDIGTEASFIKASNFLNNLDFSKFKFDY